MVLVMVVAVIFELSVAAGGRLMSLLLKCSVCLLNLAYLFFDIAFKNLISF